MTINNFIFICNASSCKCIMSVDLMGKVFNLTKFQNKNKTENKEIIFNMKNSVYDINNVDHNNINPDILSFKLNNNEDFIILLSDSITEKIQNSVIIQIIYETLINTIEN